jgi:hypothetical protein
MLFLFLEPVLKFVKIDHHFRPKKSIDTMWVGVSKVYLKDPFCCILLTSKVGLILKENEQKKLYCTMIYQKILYPRLGELASPNRGYFPPTLSNIHLTQFLWVLCWLPYPGFRVKVVRFGNFKKRL